MEILYFNSLTSTQTYLIKLLRDRKLNREIVVVALEQSSGVGSRNNQWVSNRGGLYFSFAKKSGSLPPDLPLVSSSIYFGWLMIKILREFNSKVWLKWPNDIYLEQNKVGGVITNSLKNFVVVGIGLNLKKNGEFKNIDIEIDSKTILNKYIENLDKKIAWKKIYPEIKDEFEKNRNYNVQYK